jgi:(4S)-4-hydroxy-5-phosphonooxypentane-2,3-dione isomerase
MYIVLVHVHVKPEYVEPFKEASLVNAQNSLRETGVARFDVIQEFDDPTKFVLVEAYFNQEDASKHKETQHYAIWRDTVAEMMAEPRVGVKYCNVFPEKSGWAGTDVV